MIQIHEIVKWKHTGKFCQSDEVISAIISWLKVERKVGKK